MTQLRRYTLYQLPGVAAVGAGVWFVWPWTGLATWVGVVVVVGWIAKDVALYPLLKSSYEPPDSGDPARLIAREATVSRTLAPSGYVKVGAETWRASVAGGRGEIARGVVVRIESVDGLMLTVVAPDSAFDP